MIHCCRKGCIGKNITIVVNIVYYISPQIIEFCDKLVQGCVSNPQASVIVNHVVECVTGNVCPVKGHHLSIETGLFSH